MSDLALRILTAMAIGLQLVCYFSTNLYRNYKVWPSFHHVANTGQVDGVTKDVALSSFMS